MLNFAISNLVVGGNVLLATTGVSVILTEMCPYVVSLFC